MTKNILTGCFFSLINGKLYLLFWLGAYISMAPESMKNIEKQRLLILELLLAEAFKFLELSSNKMLVYLSTLSLFGLFIRVI